MGRQQRRYAGRDTGGDLDVEQVRQIHRTDLRAWQERGYDTRGENAGPQANDQVVCHYFFAGPNGIQLSGVDRGSKSSEQENRDAQVAALFHDVYKRVSTDTKSSDTSKHCIRSSGYVCASPAFQGTSPCRLRHVSRIASFNSQNPDTASRAHSACGRRPPPRESPRPSDPPVRCRRAASSCGPLPPAASNSPPGCSTTRLRRGRNNTAVWSTCLGYMPPLAPARSSVTPPWGAPGSIRGSLATILRRIPCVVGSVAPRSAHADARRGLSETTHPCA